MDTHEMRTAVAHAKFESEADVKRIVKRILAEEGAFYFMPPANAFGRSGIADILCVWGGKPVAIETKFGKNKPTANQLKFGRDWSDAGGFFAVINEHNIVGMLDYAKQYIGGADVNRFNASV